MMFRKYSVFKPKRGDIVVDCGAHIGKYTVYASKMVGTNGKVIALEPGPENFKLLVNNCKINGCENVVLLKYAAWNSNSKLKLFISKSTTEHSLKRKSKKFIEVKSIKLEDLFEKNETEKN